VPGLASTAVLSDICPSAGDTQAFMEALLTKVKGILSA
jgi:hypothetical protein